MVGLPPPRVEEEVAAFRAGQPHGRLQGGRTASAAANCRRCCLSLGAKLIPGRGGLTDAQLSPGMPTVEAAVNPALVVPPNSRLLLWRRGGLMWGWPPPQTGGGWGCPMAALCSEEAMHSIATCWYSNRGGLGPLSRWGGGGGGLSWVLPDSHMLVWQPAGLMEGRPPPQTGAGGAVPGAARYSEDALHPNSHLLYGGWVG